MSLRRGIFYVCSSVIVGVLAFTFASCVRESRVISPNPDPPSNTDSQDPAQRNSSKSTRVGGGDCDRDDECEDQCKDLFNSNTKRKDCLELSVNEVEGMYLAFEEDNGYLAEPDEDELGDVHPEDIENALDIDDRVWTDLIDNYTRSEAERVLYWIATENNIYDAIDSSLDRDDLPDFFADILSRFIRTSSSTSFTHFITRSLGEDAEDNFVVLAYGSSESAAEFVIEEALDDCVSSASTDDSNNYNRINDEEEFRDAACLIGEALCDEDDNNYIFEEAFESIVDDNSLIQDFIESGTTNSGDDGFIDGLGVDDRNSDDISDVCEAADRQGI